MSIEDSFISICPGSSDSFEGFYPSEFKVDGYYSTEIRTEKVCEELKITAMDFLKHANENAHTAGEDGFYVFSSYPHDRSRDILSKRWYEKNAFPFLSRRRLKHAKTIYPNKLLETGQVPTPFSQVLLEKLRKNDLQQELDQTQFTRTVRPMAFYLLEPDDTSLEKRFYFVEPKNRDLEQRFANDQGFYFPESKRLNVRDLIYLATSPSGHQDIDFVSKRKKRALRNPFGKARATTQNKRRTLFFSEAGRLADTRPSSNIDISTGTSPRKGLRSVFQRNNICVISNDCAWT